MFKKKKCIECEKEFEPYDEYDDICDSCLFKRDEKDLQICYTCGEWFLAKGITITCQDCLDKERQSYDKEAKQQLRNELIN